jgi:endogenous inhibitor of DNA gyrase (YacG/DUF329 family)
VNLPKRAPRRAKRKCPICGRPPLAGHEPFCSPRCQDEDLRRWLTGTYRVKTEETPESTSQDPPSNCSEDT